MITGNVGNGGGANREPAHAIYTVPTDRHTFNPELYFDNLTRCFTDANRWRLQLEGSVAGCLGLLGPCLRTLGAVHGSSAMLSLAPALGISPSLRPFHVDTSVPWVQIPRPHLRSLTLLRQKLPSEVSEYSGSAPSRWNKVGRFCIAALCNYTYSAQHVLKATRCCTTYQT